MGKEAEYLSFVRHELRNQLVVVREGVSQALDGLGKKDCAKCFGILRPSLECADKLNDLIEDLLSLAKFQSMAGSAAHAAATELEALKKDTITMIAHEVRTPLTVIKESLAQVLDEIPAKLNDAQKKLLGGAQENADRLIESIEKILEASWDKILKPPDEQNPL